MLRCLPREAHKGSNSTEGCCRGEHPPPSPSQPSLHLYSAGAVGLGWGRAADALLMPRRISGDVEAEGPKLLADTLLEPGARKGTQRGLCPVPVQPKGTFAGLLSLQVPKGGSVCLRFKEAPLAWRVEWKEQTGASLARGNWGPCPVAQIRNIFIPLVCGNGCHTFTHLHMKTHAHPATPTLNRYSPHTRSWWWGPVPTESFSVPPQL